VARYDGLDEDALRARLDLPRVAIFDDVGSTMDAAHALAAAGAPAGSLVIADRQNAGRGRMGRHWTSAAGAGIWLTLVERPPASPDLDALPLRVGIALAPALDAFADQRVSLKWPNDLYVGSGKLAGVLTEARWRGETLEWVAIGVGINVRAPEGERAAGLASGAHRLDVLHAVLPPLRAAAARRGPLVAEELSQFAARDRASGKECIEPVRGRVCGIDPGGALLVELGSGVVAVRAGSLVLKEEQ
jgi:BirA family biotin operon repressor/biotin-[acetyl-CoA-carboxylase] ligase